MKREFRQLLSVHEANDGFNLKNVFEVAALLAEAKPVVRLVLHASQTTPVCAALLRLGLAASVSPWQLRAAYRTSLGDEYSDCGPPGAFSPDGSHVVAVSRQQALSEEFLSLEAAGRHADLGALLGYPGCCRTSYERHASDRDWLTEILANTPMKMDYPCAANRLAYLFDDCWLGYDYFPCSLCCGETIANAMRLRSIISEMGGGEWVDCAGLGMCAPILIHRGVILQLREARSGVGWAEYDLSKVRLHNWAVEIGADEDHAWDSCRAEMIPGGVRFISPEGNAFDAGGSRLLLFKPWSDS